MGVRAAEQGGAAQLRIALRGGRTVLAERYARAPLYLSPPLADTADGELALALLTTGGGLLGDEQLALHVELEPEANLALRTIGALRLLPSGSACGQEMRIRLGAGSRLTYLPEPLIPCAGASYRQRTIIELEGDATAVIGEVLSPGRLARGERFAYRHLDLGLRILRNGRPLLIERTLLEPAAGMLPQLLGEATHLASLVIAGPRADDTLVAHARALLEHDAYLDATMPAHGETTDQLPAQAPGSRAGLLGGATRPATGLVVVRVLGRSAHELQRLLAAIARPVTGSDAAST